MGMSYRKCVNCRFCVFEQKIAILDDGVNAPPAYLYCEITGEHLVISGCPFGEDVV